MPLRDTEPLPEPFDIKLSQELIERLKITQPRSVRIDNEVITTLGKAATGLTNAICIADKTKVAVKPVQEHLEKVSCHAKRLLGELSVAQRAKRSAKFLDALLKPRDAAERIAVEQLRLTFLAMDQKHAGLPPQVSKPSGGTSYLAEVNWDAYNLRRLLKYADQADEFFGLSNDELKKRFAPLIGQTLFNDKTFQFQPDPWRGKRVQPETLQLGIFAEHLIACYRWMGGKTSFHNEGTGSADRQPTPFMEFITVIRDAVPLDQRPHGDRLLNRAIDCLKAERRSA
jgi:hypothetical protein